VIDSLARVGAIVSVDTRHVDTMMAALDAGAAIVNDVTALTASGAVDLVASRAASCVLMHMQGEPRTMQANPHYVDAPREIAAYLASRIAACEAGGIPRARIAIDPGLGFGKSVAHNARLIARLDVLKALDVAVLVGASRKAFIGALSKGERPKDRLPGSLAAALAAVARGADILRVHDVAATVQALKIWAAIETERNNP
jgi:dihydropteroate synthase